MIYRSTTPPVEIPDMTLPEFVLRDAAGRGDKPALIDMPTGRTITYAALDSMSRGVGAGLQARGLEAGQAVGIFAPNLPEYAAAFLGVGLAGGVNTTVNGLYTSDELRNQLRTARARFLITIGPMLDRALPAADAAGVEEVFTFDGAEGTTPFARLVGDADALRTPELDPATALAAMPYSSGTTGFPKGVMLTHRNLVANLVQSQAHFTIGEDDVLAGVLPFFHIYGQTAIMNLALAYGASVVTMPRFDLEQFLRMIQEHRLTVAHIVPPIAVALAKHPLVDDFDLSSLRMVNSGAAPLDSELELAYTRRLGTRCQQGYGMTESSPVTHCTPGDQPHVPGTIGTLVPLTEARVIDIDTGADVEPGEPGELLVRGPQVMLGYMDDPEATAHTLDPDGWLHTGDVAVCDSDGNWRIVDRVKELIKYKGYQVPPAMLEAVLLTHEDVIDACVIGAPDEECGEIPKAYVVTRGDIDLHGLMTFVAGQVAPHERIRAVECVDEIPKSASGKLLRRVLVERERAAAKK
jgi:acyl-CoA synthetase (AMP-forming)/AMP-acid ligase II